MAIKGIGREQVDIKGKKINKISKISIISLKPVLLGIKGRIGHFLLWLLCRGEVIPFGIDQTGEGYCTKKVL